MMVERREFLRLPITVPVAVGANGHGEDTLAGTTANVSTGGLYFVCRDGEVQAGERIGIELNIPPAPGRSTRTTTMAAEATVVRVDSINGEGASERLGVACHFNSPLRFS